MCVDKELTKVYKKIQSLLRVYHLGIWEYGALLFILSSYYDVLDNKYMELLIIKTNIQKNEKEKLP